MLKLESVIENQLQNHYKLMSTNELVNGKAYVVVHGPKEIIGLFVTFNCCSKSVLNDELISKKLDEGGILFREIQQDDVFSVKNDRLMLDNTIDSIHVSDTVEGTAYYITYWHGEVSSYIGCVIIREGDKIIFVGGGKYQCYSDMETFRRYRCFVKPINTGEKIVSL